VVAAVDTLGWVAHRTPAAVTGIPDPAAVRIPAAVAGIRLAAEARIPAVARTAEVRIPASTVPASSSSSSSS